MAVSWCHLRRLLIDKRCEITGRARERQREREKERGSAAAISYSCRKFVVYVVARTRSRLWIIIVWLRMQASECNKHVRSLYRLRPGAATRGGGETKAQINFWCALNKPPLPDYLGQRLHCCRPQRRRLLQNILNYDFILIKSCGFLFCMWSTCGTWIYLVDCRWMNFHGMQIYCPNTFRFSRYQIMPQQCGQPLKKFLSPNCPSCVPGLHLKPDNRLSATHMPTFWNRLSRLSHVCALIRNFSSTYVEMSSTGRLGVIAWLWASVTYTRYYRLFFISATWLHYWWAALWQPQAAAGHL